MIGRRNLTRFLILAMALSGVLMACAREPAAREESPARRETYSLKAYKVRLRQPMELLVDGRRTSVSEVIELQVTGRHPIPARALDPVLMVGERAVTRYRYAAPNVLVFTEPAPEKLPERAPVYFQWGLGSSAAGRRPTQFTFDRQRLETRVR